MDFQNIKDIVTCAVCKSIMRNPKSLPCSHSFCRECIDQFYKNRQYSTNDARCPLCRKRFVLCFAGANNLPDNIYLKNLIDALEKTPIDENASSFGTKCTDCDGRAGSKYCLECNADLCDRCSEKHTTPPHNIYDTSSLDEAERKALEEMKLKAITCDEHGMSLSRYCCNKACMRLVCPECCLGHHRYHKVRTNAEFAPQSRERMQQVSKNARLLEVEVRNEIEGAELLMSKVMKEKEIFSRKVALDFNKLREKIAKHEDEILAEGQGFYEEKQSKLEEKIERLSNKEKTLKEIIANIKAVQSIGTDAYIISQNPHLERELEILESDSVDTMDTDFKLQLHLEKESNPGRIYEGSCFKLKMLQSTDASEYNTDDEYSDAYSEIGATIAPRNTDGTSSPTESSYDDVMQPPRSLTRQQSVLSLQPQKHLFNPYERQMSTPNLKFFHEGYQAYSNLVFQYPTKLTFEKETHITCSSTISGITVTNDNDIVAIFGNGKMVSVYMMGENGIPSPEGCNVKRNWIQPVDATAAYDIAKKKNIVYVTDSDSNNGYIFYFEIKKREPGKCKQFVSLHAQQPKGITTYNNDIYVCFPEQKSVYVFKSSGKLEQKIDLRTMCPYPIHICFTRSKAEDMLVVTDDSAMSHGQCSVVFMKTNGEHISDMKLVSNHLSQIDVDNKHTIFVGDSRSAVIHAIINDRTYTVEGDFTNILETSSLAIDKRQRLIVGHRKGIDILRVNYRYEDYYRVSP